MTINTTFAQNTQENKPEVHSSLPAIEKVYLHTDRNYYTVGENLWYKAYSVYAYTNILFDYSKLLYVELVSPEKKIVARNVTKLEAGLGHGDFILTDSIGVKPGRYQLRAYTNWTRNFDDDYIFKKEIEIISSHVRAQKSATPNKKKKKKKDVVAQEAINGPAYTIQFFPEGGSLIENVSSVVAFKATDKYGYPFKVKGQIQDLQGNIVSEFESAHDGMGRFVLNPIHGQQYIAEVNTPKDEKIKIELPKVQEYGYVLAIVKSKGKNIVSIKTNPKTLAKNPNEPISLICSTRGITYFEGAQPLAKTKLSFILDDSEFPEGISQITIYDANSKPHSERLIYIEKKNNLNISVSPNKTRYSPEEKVTIEVNAKTKEGTPLLASFSLAATEANNTKPNLDEMNICSYFLMQSDIKGYIHQPGYYFNRSNPRRLPHLDLLLLTQGWRNFLWKQAPSYKNGIKYKVEKDLTISGRVQLNFGKKKKEAYKISMMLTSEKGSALDYRTTDPNGRFKFEGISFVGATTLLLNTKNQKDENKGILYLDSIYNEPATIDYRERPAPPAVKEVVNSIKNTIYRKNIEFNIMDTNMLDEVLIKAKKKKEKRTSSIARADHEYIIDEKTPHFSSILQLLQFNVPGLIVSGGGGIRFSRFNGPPLLMVDGSEVDFQTLESITTDDVAKIETITSAGGAVYGSRGGNGVILIYTKEGKINRPNKAKYSISKKIQGFQSARVFYAPKYDTPASKKEMLPDVRNTLYWNPYVHPDANGNSTINFYNDQGSKQVNIVLEGITDTGIPIILHSQYDTVK